MTLTLSQFKPDCQLHGTLSGTALSARQTNPHFDVVHWERELRYDALDYYLAGDYERCDDRLRAAREMA